MKKKIVCLIKLFTMWEVAYWMVSDLLKPFYTSGLAVVNWLQVTQAPPIFHKLRPLVDCRWPMCSQNRESVMLRSNWRLTVAINRVDITKLFFFAIVHQEDKFCFFLIMKKNIPGFSDFLVVFQRLCSYIETKAQKNKLSAVNYTCTLCVASQYRFSFI